MMKVIAFRAGKMGKAVERHFKKILEVLAVNVAQFLAASAVLLIAMTSARVIDARADAANAKPKGHPLLLRRIDFEKGDKGGARMANGKDRKIRGAKGRRALHVKLSSESKPGSRRKSDHNRRTFFSFLILHPEDGKTYVLKIRMKTDFPTGGIFIFGMDQKGKKDGKMNYFRVKYPDPAFSRMQRVSGRNDWKEYFWEFKPVPSTETKCKTYCLIYTTIFGPVGTEAWIDDVELWEKPVYYKTGFAGKGQSAASGWTPSGKGALVDDGAGNPKPGSLRIRANSKTKQSPSWDSPYIPVPDPNVFLSCRIRDYLTFSPDPTYNVNVVMICYNRDKKLIKELTEQVSVWDGYAPDVGNFLLGSKIYRTRWHYLTKKMLLPSRTRFVRLRFGFRHSYQGSDVTTMGDAWLDDVALASGVALASDNYAGARREHAWPVWDNRNMRIHAPVFMNLFLPRDKLALDVTVLSSTRELADQSDVTLEYRVEDFFHTALLAENISNPEFQPVPAERLKRAGLGSRIFKGAFWKQIALPASLSADQAGRWLRFHCRVFKGGKLIAEGNTNFGVIRPAVSVSEEKKDFSKFAAALSVFSPDWGKCPTATGATARPAYAELFGFHWKRAGYVNNWASVQPEKNGPVNWDCHEVEKLFKSGQLTRGINNRAYIAFNSVLPHCRPRWADIPGEPVSRDSLDPKAFAKWIHAVVERYKGEGIMWIAGFSETAVNEKQARLGQVGYKAAKRADPKAVVFCNGLTGISIERMKEYFKLGHLNFTDALDLHFYYSPYATEETLDYVQAEMKKRGKVKPIWSAEIGSFCRDFETLCKDMVKKHVIAYACGMRNVSWHALSNPQTKKVNPMWRFSYVYPEGKLASGFPVDAVVPRRYEVPLPRLFTLNNLMRDLDYVVPRNKFVTEDGVRVYVFDRQPPGGRKGDTETVIALWRYSADSKGKNVALTVAGPVTVRDAFGMKHVLMPDVSGQVFLPANDNPIIINAPGSLGKVALSDPLLRIDAPAQIDLDVRVVVATQNGRPIEGAVTVKAGVGWRVEPPAAVGMRKTLTFKLTAPSGLKGGKNRILVHHTDKNGKLVGYSEFYVRYGK